MKRSLVFTLAQDRRISSLIDYPPPLIRPAFNQNKDIVFDDPLTLQKVTVLLAEYKRAGGDAAQRWRQTNLIRGWE